MIQFKTWICLRVFHFRREYCFFLVWYIFPHRWTRWKRLATIGNSHQLFFVTGNDLWMPCRIYLGINCVLFLAIYLLLFSGCFSFSLCIQSIGGMTLESFRSSVRLEIFSLFFSYSAIISKMCNENCCYLCFAFDYKLGKGQAGLSASNHLATTKTKFIQYLLIGLNPFYAE